MYVVLKAFRLYELGSLRNRTFAGAVEGGIILESCFRRLKVSFSAVLDSTCYWKGYLTSGGGRPASGQRVLYY